MKARNSWDEAFIPDLAPPSQNVMTFVQIVIIFILSGIVFGIAYLVNYLTQLDTKLDCPKNLICPDLCQVYKPLGWQEWLYSLAGCFVLYVSAVSTFFLYIKYKFKRFRDGLGEFE